MQKLKRKHWSALLGFSSVAVLCSLFWISDNETSTKKESAAAAPSSTGLTPEQRNRAQQIQAAVRTTPQSSVRPARLDINQLPDLASQVRLAESSMAERFTNSIDRKRARQRELVDRIAERYQLTPQQITIQTTNEGELRLLNFRQAIKTGDAHKVALQLLSENPELFSLSSPETLKTLSQSPVDADGIGSILYGREFKGVKVNGNDVRVLVTADGIKSVLGQFEYIDPTFDVSGSIPGAELESIASSIDGYARYTPDPTTIEPQIIFSGGLPSFVTSIKASDPWNRKIEVFIDPRKKKVVKVEEYFYDVQVEVSADDLSGNTVDFFVEDTGSISYLINRTISGAVDWEAASFEFESYDSTTGYSASNISADDSGGPWQKSAVSAMGGLLKTFKYLSSAHGLSGTGAPSKEVGIITDVRGDGADDNAFWGGDGIWLGAGSSFNNVAGSLDVIAHEVVHGVIEYSSNLRYENQSGALNESFADIFGAMVDRDDWTVGEDLNGVGLRSLRNPRAFGDPAHMSQFRYMPNTEDGDNGGVHTNSGIPNRAFYLLAEGLTSEALGTSIGKDKAEKLAYTTMINLTRDSDFQTAAALMLTSAEAKYGEGSPESLAVIAAWENVGVLLESSDDDNSPVGTRKPQYALLPGDDIFISLYPRDGWIYDAREDTFDLYAVGVCLSNCVDENYDTKNPAAEQISYVESTRTGALNDVPVTRSIPAAAQTEGGLTWVAYVGTDGDAYFSPVVNFDLEPLKFDLPENIARIGLSRDFKRFAFVLENSNDIYIYSFDTEALSIFEVEGRSYSTNGRGEDVRRVDSVSFSVDSDQVVFDYEVCRPNSDPDYECDYVWSIGILDLNKGFDYPFPLQSSGFDVGFPRFSSVGAERIVYQYWEQDDSYAYQGVRQFDYFTGLDEPIDRSMLSSTGINFYSYGWPDYSPQDKGITYTDDWDGVKLKDLNESFSYTGSDYSQGRPFESENLAGFVHRASYLNVYAESSLSSSVIDFGNVIKGDAVTRALSLENSGNQELEVTSVVASGGLEVSLSNVRLVAAGKEAFSVVLDSSAVSLGRFFGSVNIDSTADRGDSGISVTAFVDIDTDGDGIGNAIDPDDDGDGVSDAQEAIDGTDPLVSDTDGDGLTDGQEASNGTNPLLSDTDGDGFSDGYEFSKGADPLDKNSIPKSGLNILLIKAALDLKNAKEESCVEPDCANNE